jgi:hypothetical protein
LDSDDFTTRQKASQELVDLGPGIEPLLRPVLAGELSPEARRRVEGVLAQFDPLSSPARLRDLRAVEVLENVSTAEARELLEGLAKGASEARLTREAQAALVRMRAQKP